MRCDRIVVKLIFDIRHDFLHTKIVSARDTFLEETEDNQATSGEHFSSFVKNFKTIIIFGLIGAILIGAGVLAFKFIGGNDSGVEIVSVEQQETPSIKKTIFADIQGAVLRPGFYELPAGARVNDLLIKAGGLSGRADRNWVAKNINLAKSLNDGTKIYINQIGENVSGQVAGAASGVGQSESTININDASLAELDKLEGIGAARAQDIISNRPYDSVEELVSKKVLSKGVFEKIREKISVN